MVEDTWVTTAAGSALMVPWWLVVVVAIAVVALVLVLVLTGQAIEIWSPRFGLRWKRRERPPW